MAARFAHPLKTLFCLLLLASLACGGGGGGGGTTPPTDPGPTIVFLPAGAGGARTLELVSSSTSGARLTVALDVNAIADLYGVSFDLTFPSGFLRYVSAQEGSHLNAGGSLNTSLQVVESPTGNLVIGLSRLGDVAGAGGSGRLLFLSFEARSSGEGQLRFVGPTAFDSSGDAFAGLTWSGGTVRATF